jgi:hypothetical protein
MSSDVNDTPKSKVKSLSSEETQGECQAQPGRDFLDPPERRARSDRGQPSRACIVFRREHGEDAGISFMPLIIGGMIGLLFRITSELDYEILAFGINQALEGTDTQYRLRAIS